MNYYEVSPLKIIHARQSILTYESAERVQLGSMVTVPVGKNVVPAVVLNNVKKPTFDTKEIARVITSKPLPQTLLKLHNWICLYYGAHPVQVWRTMLPNGIAKKRRATPTAVFTPPKRSRQHFTFTSEQREAIDTILSRPTGTTLLHGVTGSGKTAVYIELAKQTIASGRSVILLVPEIALTSQLVAELSMHLSNVRLTHSTMTESARHALWTTILESPEPQIVVGPRSALFMPVQQLGLVIIDECHEPAFKQEKTPRYSALRAASMITQFAGARLVMGSATPSVTDYYMAKQQGHIAVLAHPARKNTVQPSVTLVDMTKRLHFSRSTILSTPFIEGISETLTRGKQALIFHNRRGSAPLTLCEGCGWSAACPRCFIPLTLHADQYILRCHLCNYTEHIPTACPSCGYAKIIHKGIGTKRLEEEIRKLFPNARIARFDGDTPEGVNTHYQALYDGDIDIIIGTQVIAKGLDLPHLRFVGVAQADSGLALPDYQSSERVFQLLTQVTGRVGRNEHASQVVIQTYQPTHPAVQYGITQNYTGFYAWCLRERQRALFPPFCHLLQLTAVYKTESGAIHASRELMKKLRESLPSSVSLLGPAPSFYERARDTYRWQIILKSPKRSDLVATLDLLPASGWQAELDPSSLL